jgi:hypothetical protein
LRPLLSSAAGVALALTASSAPADVLPRGMRVPTVETNGTCQRLAARPGHRYSLRANMQVATRVSFPSPIEVFENTLPKLWDVSTYDNSLWARPNSATPEGARTGVSVRLKNGDHYDFVFYAADSLSPSRSCVIIAPRQARYRGPTAADLAAQQAEEEARQAAFDDTVENIRRQAENQANDAIKAFQYSMNTAYEWRPASKQSAGMNGLISAAYDDGRFTYIRIRTTGYGLPALSARDGDKDLVVQYTYDDLTGVYTVLGLFDTLRLSVGTSAIDIRRKG